MIMAWLAPFWAATPGAQLLDNSTLRLDLDNEVQPDALLRIDEAHGGQSRISPDDYLAGSPELVVEIAASSAAYDLHDKLHVYRRNTVQEYVVWAMYPQRLQWFRLQEGAYVPLAAGDDGIIRSKVFPGLWLDVAALLAEKLPRVLAVLQEGIATDEHTAFVERLKEQAARKEGQS
jgi:Uma2 family endonuclease